MKNSDAFRLMKEIKETVLSTVDEAGNPQGRIIETMYADDESIYFLTARGKSVYKQLMATKRAAMTGLSHDWVSVRVSGEVLKLADNKYWIDKLFILNPSLNKIYPSDNRYVLEVFKFSRGTVETFDLSSEPVKRTSNTFGGEKLKQKGFFINDECIECDTCASGCPQNCITPGTPYVINQESCLHCGYCFENCPVSAIEKKD